MIDTCVFIDFFRATDKRKTPFTKLLDRYEEHYVSSIAKYEVVCGALDRDIAFWNSVFQQIKVLSFDDATINTARMINRKINSLRSATFSLRRRR